MPDNAIEIRGLEKRFPRFELGPLDMTVPEGAIYGFLGPNGAGKTTTIDLIMGLGRNDAGTIRVLGLDHREDDVAMKAQIGYVGPGVLMGDWRNVRSAVRFWRQFFPDWDDAYCDHLLAAFDLSWRDRLNTMSLGQRVKVALLLGMAHRPRVLLLDEPLIGLDTRVKWLLCDELVKSAREFGQTILIATHALSEVERFADHLGMIVNGQLRVEGSFEAITGRFRCVRIAGENDLARIEGLSMLRHSSDDGSVLLDTEIASLSRLGGEGYKVIDEGPAPLEELFVVLVGDE